MMSHENIVVSLHLAPSRVPPSRPLMAFHSLIHIAAKDPPVSANEPGGRIMSSGGRRTGSIVERLVQHVTRCSQKQIPLVSTRCACFLVILPLGADGGTSPWKEQPEDAWSSCLSHFELQSEAVNGLCYSGPPWILKL